MYKYGLATGETTRHLHPLSHAAKRGEANTHAVAPVAARGAARERDRPVADAPLAVTSGHTAANARTAEASVRPVADARPIGHTVTGRQAQQVIRRQKRAKGTSPLRRRRRNARRRIRQRNASRSNWSNRTPLARTKISSRTLVSAQTHCRLVARFLSRCLSAENRAAGADRRRLRTPGTGGERRKAKGSGEKRAEGEDRSKTDADAGATGDGEVDHAVTPGPSCHAPSTCKIKLSYRCSPWMRSGIQMGRS